MLHRMLGDNFCIGAVVWMSYELLATDDQVKAAEDGQRLREPLVEIVMGYVGFGPDANPRFSPYATVQCETRT